MSTDATPVAQAKPGKPKPKPKSPPAPKVPTAAIGKNPVKAAGKRAAATGAAPAPSGGTEPTISITGGVLSVTFHPLTKQGQAVNALLPQAHKVEVKVAPIK